MPILPPAAPACLSAALGPAPGANFKAYCSSKPNGSAYVGWASDGASCRNIESVTLRVGSRNVPVPASAYRDLSNARSASISRHGTQYRLRIDGGEASEAYSVALRFTSRRVERRDLFASEFDSGKPVETTIYSRASFN